MAEKLSQAEKELSKAKGMLEASESADEEITSLRSALYRAQEKNAKEELPEPTERRELPRGVVCIGGHENWIREMKLAVPDAVYLSHEVSWTDDQVRNASELWVNPKYIDHSSFWRAAGIARGQRIPILYFSSLSVKTCVGEMLGKR